MAHEGHPKQAGEGQSVVGQEQPPVEEPPAPVSGAIESRQEATTLAGVPSAAAPTPPRRPLMARQRLIRWIPPIGIALGIVAGILAQTPTLGYTTWFFGPLILLAAVAISLFWKDSRGVSLVRYVYRSGVVIAILVWHLNLFMPIGEHAMNFRQLDISAIPFFLILLGCIVVFFHEAIGGAVIFFVAVGEAYWTVIQTNLPWSQNGAFSMNLYLATLGAVARYCWWRTRLLPSSKVASTPPSTAVPGHGIHPRSWGLIAKLAMVALIIANLAWQVVLQLQPPPPPPADCGQPADATRSGAVAQFCFLNLFAGSMTAGPDGNIWFTEGGKIARITPAGTLTEFPVSRIPDFITAGPDGNLWYSGASLPTSIIRMSPRGDVKVFALPKGNYGPGPLVVGPDGNLWFMEGQGSRILAKMTLTGQITEYSLPFELSSLVPASDGNLWMMGNGFIGRITPEGVLMTKFAMATDKIVGLTAGPDGNLWFLEYDGYVGRITLAGEVKRFPAFEPTSQGAYTGGYSTIIAGPDGNLWFSAGVGKIGRITPSGTVTLLPLPPKAQVGALAAGPDGGIWFIRSDTDTSGLYWWTQIGRITP